MKSPQITIKAIDSTGTVQSLRSRKVKRIYHFIQRTKNADCMYELCVTYSTNITNAGAYYSIESLIHALKAFTEKD